ncbi:unnamed protein product [Porites evermanni]|uniref:Uncharacterized protein n=1 Tax=Porites evermanni TaxID=104178 RepID=A0ABN8LTF1_9CNID|nr:unnamed protein product [Porites evermanni]
MTVGSGEAFRYVAVHPGDHGFEARNPGALFVALSGAKSAGGEVRDPDFVFHEDILINNDRFRPVDTPTTRARAMETACLSNLAAEKAQQHERRWSFHDTPAFLSGLYRARSCKDLHKSLGGTGTQVFPAICLL